MKNIVILLSILTVTIQVKAQTVDNGIGMYNYHRWQSAQKILMPLAATDAKANYYLGLCYLALGSITEANTTFQKYPEDFANISGMARVAFAQKDVNKGMQIAKDLATKAKKKEYEQLRYAAEAVINSDGGDYLQAVAWDSLAIKRGAKDAFLFITLGDAFRKIPGGGGSAMDNYEHARDIETCNSLAFSRIGDLWMDAKNYKLALENYAKAKDCDVSNPLPYKSLADAYQQSGKYDKALENMKSYMQYSDKTLSDSRFCVELLYLSKNYCDAVQLSKDLIVIKGYPDSEITEFYGILGFAQAQCNDSVDAVNNIRTYLSRMNPSQIKSGVFIDFGKLWMRLNNLDSAALYYSKGLATDTSSDKTDIYRQLADNFKAKKNYSKSAEWYDNLIKANPNTQAYDYAWRGIMYFYDNNYEKTISAMTEFYQKYPEQPTGYLYAAKAAMKIDSESTTGLGIPHFEKWLDKVGPNYDKKNDLKIAYGYMMSVYFNKEDKENLNIYKEKLRAIAPDDSYLKQIEEMEKKANSKKKK